MATLITSSDFAGEYLVSTTAQTVGQFTALQTKVENKWLNDLLGTTIAPLLLANAAGNNGIPNDPEYLAIYNEIRLPECHGFENYSSGMKEMLISMVWFEWFKGAPFTGTTVGQRLQETTNSKPVGGNSFLFTTRYNLSINNYKVIQKYIHQNLADYPDYSTLQKHYLTQL
jgi:hypothetical protein